MRTRTRLVLALVGLTVFASACVSNAPQDSLNPQGPYARKSYDLFVPVFWVATAVFIVVEGLLVFFVFRYRRRKDQPIPFSGRTVLSPASIMFFRPHISCSNQGEEQ